MLFPFTFSKMSMSPHDDVWVKFHDVVLTKQLGDFSKGARFSDATLNAETGLLTLRDCQLCYQHRVSATVKKI